MKIASLGENESRNSYPGSCGFYCDGCTLPFLEIFLVTLSTVPPRRVGWSFRHPFHALAETRDGCYLERIARLMKSSKMKV